jgi:hypothetical protein
MKRVALLLFFLIPLAASLDAQCISGDCMNGTGIFVFSSGARYVGQFRDGKLHGVGTCTYTDGSKYQGQWAAGYPEGDGVRIEVDGTRRRGRWMKGEEVPEEKQATAIAAANEQPPAPSPKVEEPQAPEKEPVQTGCVSGDCKNGKGIFIYASGAIYIGEFKDGEIHGIGALHYSDGSKYQGQWVNRYQEGRGTKTLPSGEKWTGNWKRGQPVDDKGNILTNIFPGQKEEVQLVEVQTGCISGDCQNGDGIFGYANGSKYEGKFKDGKPHGSGTFKDVNGDVYVGLFRNGLRSGQGTLYLTDGSKQIGIWKEGGFVGKPQEEYGCLQGDCANGRGTYVSKSEGSRYVGAFQNNRPHGQGVMEYANGERYSGEWKNGQFSGRGKLFLLDGTEVSGYWDAGKYLGEKPPSREPATPAPANMNELRKAQSTRVWAVVIGIGSYNHMPTLRYTDDDAYRMYAFLKSPEGGALADDHIRLLIDEDATHENIVRAMKDVYGRAGKDDLVFLYFSGHGLKGAFLPSDFDGFNNRLEHREINAILAQSKAKYKLCIADACHSGSLMAMKSDDPTGPLNKYYEALASAESGTALIMSSKSEETSLESSGLRQGVFSHFLIRGLKGEADANNDRIVTIEELYQYIHTNVRRYTGNRQSPTLEGDFDPKMAVGVVRE